MTFCLTHHLTCSDRPPVSGDRRRRRSSDPITALHYQLSSTRAEGKLEALVLVDDAGCLVAGAGAWPVCEELAAYAPLLADRATIQSSTVRSRVAELGRDVEVRRLVLDDGVALLCSRGGTGTDVASLERAAAGCLRILAG